MSEKSNRKGLVNKGGKGVEKAKKERNRVEKAKKEGNSVYKLLEKITMDTVIDAMVEHKWLVAKTIAVHIIGACAWDKLSDGGQYIIIKRVNEIKLKTPGLM